MQRITTLMTQQTTLSDLTAALDRLTNTQNELSSGKRIGKPSDDPYGASLSVQLSGELAGLTAYGRNVDDGTAWAQSTDTSLQKMNDILQRARELLVEGGTDTASPQARAAAADEIDQLTDAIKTEANASYNGRYIFAGTATLTQPYQAGATDTYVGNTGTIARQIGPGTSLTINTDISQLLGNGQAAADNKVLNVLRDISQNLRGGTAADAGALRGTDLQHLDSNLDVLSQLEANTGALTNRLSLASARIQDLQVSRTQLLSNTEDADMAQTMVDFSTQQAAYSAALRASANIVQSSLLDFLR